MELSQILILNTDPLRERYSYDGRDLPESACHPEAPQPNLHQFDYYNRQYYLPPNTPATDGPKFYDTAHNALWRMR